jgi:hypothetical protein
MVYLTTLIISGYRPIASNDKTLLTNDELNRTWNELAMSLFEIFSRHLLRGAEENLEKCT